MYTIRKMTQSYAKDYLNWHYPAPYEFYNIPKEYHEAELKAIMAPSAHWFCVEKSGSEMVGFYQYTPLKNGAVEIGLGLKPDYTGKGLWLKICPRLCAVWQTAVWRRKRYLSSSRGGI